MKIDFYGLRQRGVLQEPDLEHELPAADAIARAKCAQPVLVKIWLRTSGRADLDGLEQRIRDAVAPAGLL